MARDVRQLAGRASGVLGIDLARQNARATWETFKQESTIDAVLGWASRFGRNDRTRLRRLRGK
jgi:hypothetical protein